MKITNLINAIKADQLVDQLDDYQSVKILFSYFQNDNEDNFVKDNFVFLTIGDQILGIEKTEFKTICKIFNELIDIEEALKEDGNPD